MPDRAPGVTDASVLAALGIGLFIAGIVLLVFAVSAMTDVIPPTYGQVTSIMLGFALGFLALVTGFLYTQVAANDEEPEVDATGLSLSRNPTTGAREWIKLDTIVKATLRPWTISPWYKTRRYFELELEVREGDMTVDDRFYVHLGKDDGAFARRLGEFLGERLQVAKAA